LEEFVILPEMASIVGEKRKLSLIASNIRAWKCNIMLPIANNQRG